MMYKRIVQSDETIIELELTQEGLIYITSIDFITNTETIDVVALNEMNKFFHVNLTIQSIKKSLELFSKNDFKTFLKSTVGFSKKESRSVDRLRKSIQLMYAESIGMKTNPSMQVGYELYREEGVLGIYLYCIDHYLYAFEESFLKEFFNADCEVSFDFFERLPQNEVFGKIVDYYSKGIRNNSGIVQKELKIYSRKKKLNHLLP